jgi:hypothetical protein
MLRTDASNAAVAASIQLTSNSSAQAASSARTLSRWRGLETWHLLSLDAPSVAAVWTWFIGQAMGVGLPRVEVAAMFVAVWILYAADRLLDARALDSGRNPEHIALEARHLFHHGHRNGFRWGIASGCTVLVALLTRFPLAELRLDVMLGGLLLGWLLAVHVGARALPKEFAVGIFFAAATALPTLARAPWLGRELSFPAVLFAALCSLNCLFISAWEQDAGACNQAHRLTRIAASHARWLGLLLAAGAAAAMPFDGAGVRPLLAAIALAALLLLAVDALRERLGRTTLRALADLVLLTPLLLIGMR